jgi:Xaa-Pro aminopeptidase
MGTAQLRVGRFLAAALALGAAAWAQAPKAKSLSRSGDGAPVCGLGKEFHAGRRAALRDALKQGVLLCRGLPDTRDYLHFQQDKVFWYLTGVESPSATLLMDLDSGREILFLPDANTGKESWEGEMWDAKDAWVVSLTGFKEVLPDKDLMKVLEEWIRPGKTVWISKHPNIALAGCADRAGPYDSQLKRDPLDGRISREAALEQNLKERFKADVKDCTRELSKLRRVKTPAEIEAMRRAGRAGAVAMAEAMRSTAPDLGEWDLDALMGFVHLREGATGPAYHAIVGSGKNSCVLHYSASSRRMQDGEVVLIDYAPEVDHYTCDITRTWPVNGKFTARQAELYDAVLAAQAAGIAAVKPGTTMRAVDQACSAVLTEKGFGNMIRHGACHYIGLEVHDVSGGDEKLVPGVAFTVEPGLYEDATGIGIRIEDVVIVTEKGCEVVSDGVPRERVAIEALIAAPGMLDGAH